MWIKNIITSQNLYQVFFILLSYLDRPHGLVQQKHLDLVSTGFPLGLENLENLEKWEGIFQSGKSQGILNRLEKSGKSQGKSHKILENSKNFRQILFFIF